MQNPSSMKIYVPLVVALCVVSSVESKRFLRTLGVPSDGNHRKTRELSSPTIPVTQKPLCPSYISCPYPPYPKPTTNSSSEAEPTSSEPSVNSSTPNESVTASATSLVNGDVVDRFNSSSEGSTQEPLISSEAYPNNDKSVGLGNANGPSISATQKPTCPGYITCPYPPYPRPTTKSSDSYGTSSSTTVNPNKEIANRTEYEETKPSETSMEPVIDKNETTDLGSISGPSISATQKPPCPSYIQCPYPPYPRPTTKSPEASAVSRPTTASPNITVINRIETDETGPTEPPSASADTERDESSEPGNATGPSISATQKPPCPGYINCPYPLYPKPTTEPLSSSIYAEDSTSPENVTKRSTDNLPLNPPKESVDLEEESITAEPQNIQDKIDPASSTNSPLASYEATTLSHSDVQQNDENSFASEPTPDSDGKPTEAENYVFSQKPSSTELPLANNPSSHITQDWNFPGSSGNGQTPTSIIPDDDSKTSTHELVEYANDYQKPSQSATRKPECPFYISCPLVYPKPTTASPIVHNVHAYASSSVNVQSHNNRMKPTVFAPNHPKLANPNIANDDVDSLESSTIDPVELGNQGAYLPIYSYVYGFDVHRQNSFYNPYYKNPSVLLTPRPFWPSYLQNPWIYPKPFRGYVNDYNVPINSNEDEIPEEERYLSETDYNIY